MKNNRHSEKLDALLGKLVIVKFKDGTQATGVLNWNERYSTENPYKAQMYLLHLGIAGEQGTVALRKTNVKNVTEIE